MGPNPNYCIVYFNPNDENDDMPPLILILSTIILILTGFLTIYISNIYI